LSIQFFWTQDGHGHILPRGTFAPSSRRVDDVAHLAVVALQAAEKAGATITREAVVAAFETARRVRGLS
jgi:hypothetical protein